MSKDNKRPSVVGERVKRAREAVDGLTAKELAALAGLSSSHVGMIERGDVSTPGLPVITKLARVLGVSRDWLLGDDVEFVGDDAVRVAVSAARESVANDSAKASA